MDEDLEPPEKEVAVSFVRRYALTQHVCPVCGTSFAAPRLRVYCGLPCKQRAAWQRNGAEFSERRRKRDPSSGANMKRGGDNGNS